MTRRSESGMTLVELLVAISILSIISFALTESVIQALRTADVTAKRFGESIDAQLLAASFGTDIQSADEVVAPFVPSPASPCTAPSGGAVLLLRWTDGSLSKQASYILEASSGPERHLVRRYCEADSRAPDPSVVRLLRQHAVASFVAPDGADPVGITCSPGPACPSKPQTVSMSITDASGYTFTASGSRRAT